MNAAYCHSPEFLNRLDLSMLSNDAALPIPRSKNLPAKTRPRKRLTREERAGDARATIFAAAAQVVGKYGYAYASISRIKATRGFFASSMRPKLRRRLRIRSTSSLPLTTTSSRFSAASELGGSAPLNVRNWKRLPMYAWRPEVICTCEPSRTMPAGGQSQRR